MKKTGCSILLMALLLLPMAGAGADALYAPMDEFLMGHWDECAQVLRDFYVDRPGGVTFYAEPGSDAAVDTLQRGEKVHVYFTYELGSTHWGLVEPGGFRTPSGWLDMNAMLLAYDGIAFLEEFGEQCVPNNGQYTIESAAGVVIWPYPGAAEPIEILPDDLTGDIGEIRTLYTDDDGLLWGSGDRFYGHRQSWICLSAPTSLEVAGVHDIPHTGRWEPPATRGGPSLLTLTALLVAALVAGTALLIRLFYRAAR